MESVKQSTVHNKSESNKTKTENSQKTMITKREVIGVREMLVEGLRKKFEFMSYEPDLVQLVSRDFSDGLKNGIKEKLLMSSRVVVQTVICEARGQGIQLASKQFWNNRSDHLICEVFENDSLAVVCLVMLVSNSN